MDEEATAPAAPTRAEVEVKFLGLIDRSISRDEADRWAAQWVATDAAVEDGAVWWALGLLYGIDLQHGPNGPYLHDEAQISGWLEEFRTRYGPP
jgi:hypothetical protein